MIRQVTNAQCNNHPTGEIFSPKKKSSMRISDAQREAMNEGRRKAREKRKLELDALVGDVIVGNERLDNITVVIVV